MRPDIKRGYNNIRKAISNYAAQNVRSSKTISSALKEDKVFEEPAGIMAGFLEQSKEEINRLIEEIKKENAKGNENQALTEVLTLLSDKLKTIDEIAIGTKPENAVKAIEEIVKSLREKEPNLGVHLSLRSEILRTTIPALESIIKTMQEKHAGSPLTIEDLNKLRGIYIPFITEIAPDVNAKVENLLRSVNAVRKLTPGFFRGRNFSG